MVASINNGVEKTQPLNLPIKISLTLLVDSGSTFSILDKTHASRAMECNSRAIFVSEMNKPQLHTLSNEPN